MKMNHTKYKISTKVHIGKVDASHTYHTYIPDKHDNVYLVPDTGNSFRVFHYSVQEKVTQIVYIIIRS